jgi:hypothetical protein
VSVVQIFPSSQFSGVPLQIPAKHLSALVHGFPSLHESLLLIWTQALVASHVSKVHGLPSSQPSAVWVQPNAVQASVVHDRPSSQVAVPLWQMPLTQVSTPLHGSPSLQLPVRLLWLHTSVDGLQVSAVQTLLSSQNAVPTHCGPVLVTAQRSLFVQGLPSLQGLVLAERVTQPFWMHESFVQILPSHSCGPCCTMLKHPPGIRHCQKAQALLKPQRLACGVYTQPVLAWHESTVQEMLSLQVTAVPPTQLPPLHDIPVRQRFPEVHEPGALARRQEPVAGSHESAVQLLPSSQLIGGWLHAPVVGSHTSCVHGFESAQPVGVPWHTSASPDAMQVSPEVQRL